MFQCTEYWLSSLKIVTIFIFIILGICVNAGVNPTKEYIGFRNWTIDGAPFIGGFGGFARVFVTASFACKQRSLAILTVHLLMHYCRRRYGESWDHSR